MIKINNFKIANYMGFKFQSLDNNVYNICYEDNHRYDKGWDKLMPVLLKIQSDHRSLWRSNSFGFKEIREALVELDFKLLYKSIVAWIDVQNSRNNK